MKITNLTPHPLTLHGDGGEINIPASGLVARLEVSRRELPGMTIDGVKLPINIPTMGGITGLPEPIDGEVFVVSAMVAQAAARRDVMSPGELVRSPEGVIVGALGLCAYVD